MNLLKKNMRSQDRDAIVEALMNHDLNFLSEEQREYFNRLSYADDIMRDYANYGKGRKHIVNNLMIKFKVSETTAYKILNDAVYVFRTKNILDKDYWKTIVLDWQINAFKLMMVNPNKNFKHINSAIGNIIKILGFDKRDPEPVTAEMLGNNNYYMIMNFNDGRQSMKLDLKQIPTLKYEERMSLMEAIVENTAEVDFEKILDADQ